MKTHEIDEVIEIGVASVETKGSQLQGQEMNGRLVGTFEISED